MRILHLADLHLGKRLGNISLCPDQEYILQEILRLIKEYTPDALLLAGDIYDRSTPATDAVEMFDEFLTRLVELKIPVLAISGNHDSPERLDFASRIISHQGIHVAGSFNGNIKEIELMDEHGPVFFHLLPFIRPAHVRRFFPQDELPSYDAACRRVLDTSPRRPGCRYVLLAHQFVTNNGQSPERSDSEQISVGGVDNIDSSAFAGYSYVALGHIHKAQTAGNEFIRYAGSPLKYSFSEVNHHKSVPLVEIDAAGQASVELIPLNPLHDMRRIKGPLEKLLSTEVAGAADRNDYLQVVLTDEEDLVAPLDCLRHIYPNVLKLDFANSRSQLNEDDSLAPARISKSPEEMFRDFYKLQQNIEPAPEKMAIVRDIFAKLEGEK